MKKTIGAVLAMVLLSLGLVLGCSGVVISSGKLVTEEFNLIDFNRVEVSSAFEVEITQSGSYSVSITADDNLFEYIQVFKEGETIRIGVKPIVISGRATLKAEITMPDLYGLDLSGATRGTVQGFSSAHDFILELSEASSLDMADMSAVDTKFDVSGASKVIGDITAGNAEFEVSGGSTVQLEGSANDIVVDASGVSRVKLAAFPVSNADVRLRGASNGTVNLDGRLDAILSGASKLDYIGEPMMGTIITSDASTLSKQ